MDVSDSVIRDQEVLLPSHVHVIGVLQTLVVKVVRVEVLCILIKREKLALEKNEKKIMRSCPFKISIFKLPSVSCRRLHLLPISWLEMGAFWR